VSHLVASRDGKTLFTVGTDCAIKVWKNWETLFKS
jgi:hypothetical protein